MSHLNTYSISLKLKLTSNAYKQIMSLYLCYFLIFLKEPLMKNIVSKRQAFYLEKEFNQHESKFLFKS